MSVSTNDQIRIGNENVIKKKFENNTKIKASMMVKSISKIVTKVASDVIQNNSAIAASATGASNKISLSSIKCDTVNITNVYQDAVAIAQTNVKTSQSNSSKISNDISTSIDKSIEKIGSPDIAGFAAENTSKLNTIMSETPGYNPNAIHDLVGACPGTRVPVVSGMTTVSSNNNCAANASYSLNASLNAKLELDNDFKINDEDNISNSINNKITSTNFASCSSSATANNSLNFIDIICSAMNLTNISQKAVSQLYMTCVFDQTNVSDISNKIKTKITKKYNQIYDAVAKKAQDKGSVAYYNKATDLLDTFSASGIEKLAATAGILAEAEPTQISTNAAAANSGPASTTTSTALPTYAPINVDLDRSKEIQARSAAVVNLANVPYEALLKQEQQKASADQMNKLIIIFGIGIIIIIIIIGIITAILMYANKSTPIQDTYDTADTSD